MTGEEGILLCFDCRVGGCRHGNKVLDHRGVRVCANPRPATTSHGNPLCDDCASQADVRHQARRHGGLSGAELQKIAEERRKHRFDWLFGADRHRDAA